MLEKLKQKFLQLRDSGHLNLAILAAAAIPVTAFIIFILWRSTQTFTALFGAQEQVPVAQVVEVLSGESITFRIDPNGGQILVAESQLSRARMALAAKGITVKVPIGYEIMDQEGMLGSSQFMQNVRYKRSLEGELAQSVMALDPVVHARVHLGISESSSFVINNKPDSTASVVVRLHYGRELSDEQIGAIIRLVSGSVPGLKADGVQVVDQEGRILSDRYQSDSSGMLNMRNAADLTRRLQSDIERNVAHLLISLVGSNNYRVSVMPQLDLSRVEETQERFNGDPRVTSENIHQENMTDELAIGVPGALSNRPANQAANNNAANNAALSTRNQAQRNFSYDRDIRHIRHPEYRVEKMTVAIVLNRDAPALEGWTDEKLAELNQLISNAAGINAERGDSLSLSMMTFTAPIVAEELEVEWWRDPSIIRWAEMGGIGLLALLFLLFGVRPLIARLAKPRNTLVAAAKTAEPKATEEEDEHHVLLNNEVQLKGSAFQGDDKLPPQSSGLETKIAYLQLLAETETERVAEVIKQWINSNATAPSSNQAPQAPNETPPASPDA